MAKNGKSKTQYLVLGRCRKDTKFEHQYGWFDTLWEAEQAMERAKRTAKLEHDRKQRSAGSVGGFGVNMEYHSDYDVMEVRIYTRQVTPWQVYKEDSVSYK